MGADPFTEAIEVWVSPRLAALPPRLVSVSAADAGTTRFGMRLVLALWVGTVGCRRFEILQSDLVRARAALGLNMGKTKWVSACSISLLILFWIFAFVFFAACAVGFFSHDPMPRELLRG